MKLQGAGFRKEAGVWQAACVVGWTCRETTPCATAHLWGEERSDMTRFEKE